MRSSNNYSISLFSVLADPRETRRVDTYLSALFPEKSRSYIQKMIEEGKITCNGGSFTKNKKIYRGDVIEIAWKVEDMTLEAEDMPLDIVFEDDDFAIINKDAGINTHPTPGEDGRKGTLVNALLYHFKKLPRPPAPSPAEKGSDYYFYPESSEGETLLDQNSLSFRRGKGGGSIINGVERPGIVHRLDKDTSGLIIIAKNDKSMHALQQKIAKRTIEKTYLALVVGKVKDEEGYIESFIGRDPYDRKKMTVQDPLNPKIAKTKFINRGIIEDKYTLLEVDLLTGRTHQIRVHLASIGYPIVGDRVYGIEKANKEALEKYGLARQWLHAWKLAFTLFGRDYAFVGLPKADLREVPGISEKIR